MIEVRIDLTDRDRVIGTIVREAASEAEAAFIVESCRRIAAALAEELSRPAEDRVRADLASPLARLGRKTPPHQAAAAPEDG